MIDKKIWDEAFNLAKDQIRHGKVYYQDLESVTQDIYQQMILVKQGPACIDVEIVQPLSIESKSVFKHEVVEGKVKCGECGESFMSLTIKHLKKHGFATREEYMQKHGVIKKDMSGDIVRKVAKGADNPLKLMNLIMQEYNVPRGEIIKFVNKYGFKDLIDLKKQAKDRNKDPMEFLAGSIPIEAPKKVEKVKETK